MSNEQETMEHIYNALYNQVTELGLNIELSTKNQFNEESPLRIKITHPAYTDFLAEILGKEWNQGGKASLYLKNSREISRKSYRNYSDGSTQWISDKYDYHRQLTNDQKLACGVNPNTYSHNPVYDLHVSFKATKSPKLICNDVMPALTNYLKIVEIASPLIDADVTKQASLLTEQNEIDALCRRICGYPLAPNDKPSRHDYNVPNIGKVSYDEYGRYKIEKEVSRDELLAELNKIKGA